MATRYEDPRYGIYILTGKGGEGTEGIRSLYSAFNSKPRKDQLAPGELVSNYLSVGIKTHNIEKSRAGKLSGLQKLNAVVLRRATEETDAMIREHGMPWPGADLFNGRERMSAHIQGLIGDFHDMHNHLSFADLVSAEIKFLGDLRIQGEARVSDRTGMKYNSSFSDSDNNEGGNSYRRSMTMQATNFLKPCLDFWNMGWSRAMSFDELEQQNNLTQAYDAIHMRAGRWLRGIHEVASDIPEAYVPPVRSQPIPARGVIWFNPFAVVISR